MKLTGVFLLILGAALIGVGVALDEPAAAMMNAVMLCLACLGVG